MLILTAGNYHYTDLAYTCDGDTPTDDERAFEDLRDLRRAAGDTAPRGLCDLAMEYVRGGRTGTTAHDLRGAAAFQTCADVILLSRANDADAARADAADARVPCHCGDASCVLCDDNGTIPASDATRKYFAAIGDDGMRPVVWGLGYTREEAGEEAETQFRESGCRSEYAVEEITEADYARVNAGDVSWPAT